MGYILNVTKSRKKYAPKKLYNEKEKIDLWLDYVCEDEPTANGLKNHMIRVGQLSEIGKLDIPFNKRYGVYVSKGNLKGRK